MKKFLLLFAAISAVVFVSCQKDEDKDKNSLEGTTWTFFESDGYTLSETLMFQAGGKAIWSGQYVDSSVVENYSDVCTYTYNAPNVMIQVPGEGGIDIYTGTVNGKSLTLLYNNGEIYGVFQKK